MGINQVCLLILTSLMLGSQAGALSDAALTKRIRQDVLDLSDDAINAGSAVEHLKSYPRVEVLKVLAEDLQAEPLHPPTLTLKAIDLLDAVELAPDLIAASRRSENWTTILTLNHLSRQHAELRPALAILYKDLLKTTVSPVMRIALMESLAILHVPIEAQSFEESLASHNFQIRIAAVKNFLASRESLDSEQRNERFRAALSAKPYQARLPAMQAFGKMSPAEQQ